MLVLFLLLLLLLLFIIIHWYLLSTHYVPGTVLSTQHILFHVLLTSLTDRETILSPICTLKKKKGNLKRFWNVPTGHNLFIILPTTETLPSAYCVLIYVPGLSSAILLDKELHNSRIRFMAVVQRHYVFYYSMFQFCFCNKTTQLHHDLCLTLNNMV